jgi:hypothetical protein
MAVESLDVNDPYVPERMFAAAYGVLMGRQCAIEEVREPLEWLLPQLKERMFGEDATTPTNHWMTRAYVRGIVGFAQYFVPDAIPGGVVDSDGRFRFAPAAYRAAESVKDQHSGHFGHDFENHEVGRLFHDREKYDYNHEAFAAAMTEIRGRVWELGWRESEFKDIDSDIAGRFAHRRGAGRPERYAEKYGWIGLHEKAGVLTDANQLPQGRRAQLGNPIVDIDPSFPREPPSLPLVVPNWLGHPANDDRGWLASGEIVVPDELLRARALGDDEGPWIAVDGFLEMTDKVACRSVFGFIRGILVTKEEAGDVVSLLNSRQYLGNDYIPEEPSDYYTFAGEIPWSDDFAADQDYDEELGPYEGRVGGHWEDGPVVEVLSHRYAWETYHSSVNRASGYSVPSKLFSQAFRLRSAPSSFNQFDPNGRLAAISCSPPESFDPNGNVLYLREDLLWQYADARKRELVWVVWGERHVTHGGYNRPDWCREVYREQAHLWRRIVTLGDLIRHL